MSLDGSRLLDPSGSEEAAWTQAAIDVVSDEAEAEASGDSSAAAAADASPCASVTVAYMPSLRQITSVTQSGSTTAQQVAQMTRMCVAGCEQLNGLMRECLVEAAKKKIAAAQ